MGHAGPVMRREARLRREAPAAAPHRRPHQPLPLAL